MPSNLKIVEIIVPVHNEASSLDTFIKAFQGFKDSHSQSCTFRLLFVDDGSTDSTPTILADLLSKHSEVRTITLARNYGKESALFAGITLSSADAVIPMDVDLQDPFEVIPQFLAHWEAGAKMVVGKRIDRSDESLMKRTFAHLFYRMYNKFADIVIPENVGDFRLLDREIVERVSQIQEHNKFMKGIFAYVGKVDAEVPYVRPLGQRSESNKPTQTFSKLIKLGEEAFSGSGTKFFRKIFISTIAIDIIFILYALFILYQKIINHLPFQGFASITILVVLSSSVQITLLSFIGIIASKILSESKNRPSYFKTNSSSRQKDGI
jgi:glycosyltransferase involved in cell wall biosynthesis